jgi:SAM-dependent methyltransferase
MATNLTRAIGDDWKTTRYYDDAEQECWLQEFWSAKSPFRQQFERLDTDRVVELACGHGRHTARLLREHSLKQPSAIWLVDINEENIAACRARFAELPIVQYHVNNGADLHPIADQVASAIFCFDAMVHFEYDAVMAYIADAHRVLRPGGRALFHHSNFDGAPGNDYRKNPRWRNFMTRNLFAHVALRRGFTILDQIVLDWGAASQLDCLSLLEKPQSLGLGSVSSSSPMDTERWRVVEP